MIENEEISSCTVGLTIVSKRSLYCTNSKLTIHTALIVVVRHMWMCVICNWRSSDIGAWSGTTKIAQQTNDVTLNVICEKLILTANISFNTLAPASQHPNHPTNNKNNHHHTTNSNNDRYDNRDNTQREGGHYNKPTNR